MSVTPYKTLPFVLTYTTPSGARVTVYSPDHISLKLISCLATYVHFHFPFFELESVAIRVINPETFQFEVVDIDYMN